MPFIESGTVPDTVQLMVLVAGLCSSAPAFEIMRPAGIAPLRNAQRNSSRQWARFSGVSSTSARALATRSKVLSIVVSRTSPSFVLSRYFLSQISVEANWKEIDVTLDSDCLRFAIFMWRRSLT